MELVSTGISNRNPPCGTLITISMQVAGSNLAWTYFEVVRDGIVLYRSTMGSFSFSWSKIAEPQDSGNLNVYARDNTESYVSWGVPLNVTASPVDPIAFPGQFSCASDLMIYPFAGVVPIDIGTSAVPAIEFSLNGDTPRFEYYYRRRR